jgi:hypothetical protein
MLGDEGMVSLRQQKTELVCAVPEGTRTMGRVTDSTQEFGGRLIVGADEVANAHKAPLKFL